MPEEPKKTDEKAPEETPEEEKPETDEAEESQEEEKEESQEEEKEEKTKEEEPPAWAKSLSETVSSLSQKMEELTQKPSETTSPQEPKKKTPAEEWSWEQIDAGWEKVDAGEWGIKEARQLRKIERQKTESEIENRTQQNVQVSKKVQDFASKASQSWLNVEAEIPELKDKESPVYKKARDLFMQDPASRVFIEGNKDISNLQKYDLSLVNPNLMANYAREAKRVIDSSKPVSKGKKAAKTALSGGTVSQASKNLLSKLEEQAVESGSQQDWRRYFKEKEKSRRQKADLAS